MHSTLLSFADRQAPRYTSYPTAPNFTAAVGPDEVRRWLNETPSQARLSLYVHVPYCREICWYCGCNTFAAPRTD